VPRPQQSRDDAPTISATQITSVPLKVTWASVYVTPEKTVPSWNSRSKRPRYARTASIEKNAARLIDKPRQSRVCAAEDRTPQDTRTAGDHDERRSDQAGDYRQCQQPSGDELQSRQRK